MGDNFCPVVECAIGEEPFVAADKAGGDKIGLKAHGMGLYGIEDRLKER